MKKKLDNKPFISKISNYLNLQNLEEFQNLLKDNKAIVAGGSVLSSYFSNGIINNVHIYINEKNSVSFWKQFIKIFNEHFQINSSQPKKDYDDNVFFKKNIIKGRFSVKFTDKILYFIIVNDEIEPESVISNFDLTFCEIWFDGTGVYANYPDDIRNKKCTLKDEYVKILIENDNTFLKERIKNYEEKGFEVIIPENNYIFEEQINIISSPLKWYSYILYNEFLKQYENVNKNIPAIIDLPIKDYTIEELFKYTINGYKLHVYDEYVRKDQKYIIIKYNEIFKPIIIKNSLILKTNIGEQKSVYYNFEPSLYFIDMSKEFVKHTQYKPLPLYHANVENGELVSDENVKTILRSDNPGMIYSCPKGHLHYSDNCGAPLELARCGIEDCDYIVGGYSHMLVPGNHFVYIKDVSNGYHFTLYGKFPIHDYDLYKKILKQTNEINEKHGFDTIKPVENKDNTLKARRIQENDVLRQDVNEECGIYMTPFDVNPNGSIDKKSKDTYILPCGHLMEKEAVENSRTGPSKNRKCPFDKENFLFGKVEHNLQKKAANCNIYITAIRKNNKYLIYEFKNEEWKTKNDKFHGRWVSEKLLNKLISEHKNIEPTYKGLQKFFNLKNLNIDKYITKEDTLLAPLYEKEFGYYKKAKKLNYV